MRVEDSFGKRSALAERKSKWLSATTQVSFIPDGKYLFCSATRIFTKLDTKRIVILNVVKNLKTYD